MKEKTRLSILSGFLVVSSFPQVKDATLSKAASKAINPIAQVIRFQLQPNYYMF